MHVGREEESGRSQLAQLRPLSFTSPLSLRGAGLWFGERVRGGVRKGVASPDLVLNIYPFGCCQLRFPDEMSLVMENWKQELPFLRVGLFVNSVQARTGRGLVGRQLPSGRASALQQSRSQDRICPMHFGETVDFHL